MERKKKKKDAHKISGPHLLNDDSQASYGGFV